jgi:hypothetical protein
MSATASQVRRAIAGADYPATPDALIELAEERGAAPDVLAELEGLADDEYESAKDVLAELGGDDDDEDDEERDDEDPFAS